MSQFSGILRLRLPGFLNKKNRIFFKVREKHDNLLSKCAVEAFLSLFLWLSIYDERVRKLLIHVANSSIPYQLRLIAE
jgi:hypothetical protein